MARAGLPDPAAAARVLERARGSEPADARGYGTRRGSGEGGKAASG